MEQILVNAVCGRDYQTQFAAVTEMYREDLDATRLQVQLDTLKFP